MIPIVLIATLLVGGGVTVAAENSLPGSPLYEIKTSVNEEIRGKLALNAELRAGWETELMERRLEEAERLAAQGRLDAEIFAETKTNFDKHSGEAQRHIRSLYLEGNADAAYKLNTRLQSAIEAHQRILADLEKMEQNHEHDFGSLTARMEARTQSLIALREDMNATVQAASANQSTSNDAYLEGSAYASSNVTTDISAQKEERTKNGNENPNQTNVRVETETEGTIRIGL